MLGLSEPAVFIDGNFCCSKVNCWCGFAGGRYCCCFIVIIFSTWWQTEKRIDHSFFMKPDTNGSLGQCIMSFLILTNDRLTVMASLHVLVTHQKSRRGCSCLEFSDPIILQVLIFCPCLNHGCFLIFTDDWFTEMACVNLSDNMSGQTRWSCCRWDLPWSDKRYTHGFITNLWFWLCYYGCGWNILSLSSVYDSIFWPLFYLMYDSFLVLPLLDYAQIFRGKHIVTFECLDGFVVMCHD